MRRTDPERLGYRNGDHLSAADLVAEQDYHLRIRRVLTRVLTDPGVAAGMEVSVEADRRRVVVSPGLAIDDLGRDIVLGEPRKLTAAQGYLVIGHREEVVGHGVPARGQLRVRRDPALSWHPTWPPPELGLVVLAAAELAADCTVRSLREDVRRRSGAPQRPPATGLAIEGEQGIDQRNPAELTFHWPGAPPAAAALHLRAAAFPALHYTAMGGHTHPMTVKMTEATITLAHHHALPGGTTEADGRHTHRLRVEKDAEGIDEHSGNLGWTDHVMTFDGDHSHRVARETEPALGVWTHDHTVTATVGDIGATDVRARNGARLGFPEGLRVAVDGADLTERVLAQLRDRDGDLPWPQLGTGAGDAQDELATHGTGEIDLLRLGVDFSAGEHRIVLSVPSKGGTVGYNLYVE